MLLAANGMINPPGRFPIPPIFSHLWVSTPQECRPRAKLHPASYSVGLCVARVCVCVELTSYALDHFFSSRGLWIEIEIHAACYHLR